MEHRAEGKEREQGMRERKRIRVKGDNLPVMEMEIQRGFYPPKPQSVRFPPAPKGLSKAELEKWMRETSGKVDAAVAEENAKWKKERERETRIRIEFMSWAWIGRELGGEPIGEIKLGLINDTLQLCLPDGRKIYGRTEDLPPEKVLANKAILDSEGASVAKLSDEDSKLLHDVKNSVENGMRGVSEMGYRLDQAAQNPIEFKNYLVRNLNLTTHEGRIDEELRKHNGDTSKASRALITLYGKGKGYSQPNVYKTKKKLEAKIGTLMGRNPRAIYSNFESDAWGIDENGHRGPIRGRRP